MPLSQKPKRGLVESLYHFLWLPVVGEAGNGHKGKETFLRLDGVSLPDTIIFQNNRCAWYSGKGQVCRKAMTRMDASILPEFLKKDKDVADRPRVLLRDFDVVATWQELVDRPSAEEAKRRFQDMRTSTKNGDEAEGESGSEAEDEEEVNDWGMTKSPARTKKMRARRRKRVVLSETTPDVLPELKAGATMLHKSDLSKLLQARALRHGILQKYVLPRTDHEEVLRITWTPGAARIEERQNSHTIVDRGIDLYLRTVAFEHHLDTRGDKNSKDGVYTTRTVPLSSPLGRRLNKSCSDIAGHIDALSRKNRASVSKMVLYFKRDVNNHLWLLHCDCLNFQNDGVGQPFSPIAQPPVLHKYLWSSMTEKTLKRPAQKTASPAHARHHVVTKPRAPSFTPSRTELRQQSAVAGRGLHCAQCHTGLARSDAIRIRLGTLVTLHENRGNSSTRFELDFSRVEASDESADEGDAGGAESRREESKEYDEERDEEGSESAGAGGSAELVDSELEPGAEAADISDVGDAARGGVVGGGEEHARSEGGDVEKGAPGDGGAEDDEEGGLESAWTKEGNGGGSGGELDAIGLDDWDSTRRSDEGGAPKVELESAEDFREAKEGWGTPTASSGSTPVAASSIIPPAIQSIFPSMTPAQYKHARSLQSFTNKYVEMCVACADAKVRRQELHDELLDGDWDLEVAVRRASRQQPHAMQVPVVKFVRACNMHAKPTPEEAFKAKCKIYDARPQSVPLATGIRDRASVRDDKHTMAKPKQRPAFAGKRVRKGRSPMSISIPRARLQQYPTEARPRTLPKSKTKARSPRNLRKLDVATVKRSRERLKEHLYLQLQADHDDPAFSRPVHTPPFLEHVLF